MKFMEFCLSGRKNVRVGVESGSGILDLTSASGDKHVPLDAGATLEHVIKTEGALEGLQKAVGALSEDVIEKHRVPASEVLYRRLVARPEKVIGIGMNYHDHAEELGMGKPSEPFLFAMWSNALIGHDDPIVIPRFSSDIDYEAELAVVIGKTGRHIPPENAADFIAGYTIVNDVSARDLQMKDNQWIRGKSFDTALPIGPVLATADGLALADGLEIELRLNGTTMQHSNTRNLIFKVPELLAYISEGLTLKPGDVIATGTPGGVGFKRNPPVFLKPGDVVEIDLEGVGTLRNPVTSE